LRIDANQLGRRNLSPDQSSLLRGRRYNRTKKVTGRPKGGQNDPIKTYDKLATEHGVSPSTSKRDGQFAAATVTISLTRTKGVVPTMEQQVVSISEFAKAWGVSRSTVYRWLREKRVIARKSPSGRRVISARYLPEKPLDENEDAEDAEESLLLARAAVRIGLAEYNRDKSRRRW